MINTAEVSLNNGVSMPWVGLGVYKAESGAPTKNAVLQALKDGYRSIDTASFYGNEKSVGEAIQESGVPREEIFLTTKVWNDEQGFEQTMEAFERSRQNLGVDVIDLYLIHWPVPGKYKETWGAMEKLYEQGKVKAIGVSNFTEEHLENLMKEAKITPAVNQVEYHPKNAQKKLLEYCETHGIQMEAWRPLGRGDLLEDETIKQIADRHGKTPAQVLIRWCLETKVVTIPKSITPERITANAQVFDFSLTAEDIQAIDGMNEDQRYGYHPDDFPYDK